jgi:2-phosphosulfolactate phosphatase
MTRLILPSPNGSTLSTLTGTVPTFAGCFRNARSIADAVAHAAQQAGNRVTVIAAGEKWSYDNHASHDTLRPALEDQAGCGAIIHELRGNRSPEAQVAEAAFLSIQANLTEILQTCSSGRELIEKGRLSDVILAAELNPSRAAPRLVDGAYQWREQDENI